MGTQVENRKTAVICDHSFHKITGGSRFLWEMFAEIYEVVMLWDDSWKGGASPSIEMINSTQPSIVIFVQTILAPDKLKQLSCSKIIWCPMYDDFVKRPQGMQLLYGKESRLVKLCFSENLAKRLNGEVLSAKYFCPPIRRTASKRETLRVFFWQRTREVDWPIAKALLGEELKYEIVVRQLPDPGSTCAAIPQCDIERFNIEVVNGWLDRADYLRVIENSDVFIAPRRYEGIGMSFLEAMAMGLCVIACNSATANEYIVSGETGLLYNPENPEVLDLSMARNLGEAARKSVAEGYERWVKQKAELLEHLKS